MANSTITTPAHAIERSSLSSANITSEDDLRNLPTGVYTVTGPTSGVIPFSYGVLVMFRSEGEQYRLALGVNRSNGATYVRTASSTQWQYAWVQL